MRNEFLFFLGSWKYERNGSRAKLTWCPNERSESLAKLTWRLFHLIACDPLLSYFNEPQKNDVYFLNDIERSIEVFYIQFMFNILIDIGSYIEPKKWMLLIIIASWYKARHCTGDLVTLIPKWVKG